MKSTPSGLAAAYVRSSKDRSDVSLSAQMHELKNLAQAKDLKIVRTYEDAVQSGSTEDRPGFLELTQDLKNQSRGWAHLLIYDTSRLARGRHIAQAFRYECRRRGVELLIAKMPETDPISAVILESVMEAMDEVHSLMSREKGLAGMRENVRRGFRAGGKAPWGYVLEHQSTGAVRDGRPVLKSTLRPGPDAETAAKYLRQRVAGVPRTRVARELGIKLNKSSLIGVEHNALVYAGHTVWNQHAPKRARGDGHPKRRPRSEWVISRDTHPALISEADAESLISQLATSDLSRAISIAKASSGTYLLSGLLVTSDGQPWVGAGAHYRLKPTGARRGKFVARDSLDAAVTGRIEADLASDAFIRGLTTAVRTANAGRSPAVNVEKEIANLERKQERAARMAVETGEDAYRRVVESIAAQVDALRHEAAALAAESRAGNALQNVSRSAVRQFIRQTICDGIDAKTIRALVARVVMDPGAHTVRVEYCLPVASPRRSDRWAVDSVSSTFELVA